MQKIIFEKPNYLELRKKNLLCVDMHYHTTFSDGSAEIPEILEKIKRLNIGIAITDHNEINGSLELKNNLEKHKLNNMLIPGIEVKSDELIDILFYFYDFAELKKFYEKEINPNRKKFLHSTKTNIKLEKLLSLSKKYYCIASVAHPYGYGLRGGKGIFNDNKKILKNFENIELMNGGNSRKENLLALDLIIKNKKGFTGGSDGHTLSSLGNILTCARSKNIKEFLDAIKTKKNFVIGNENNFGKYGEYIKYGLSKIKKFFK